MWYQPFFCIPYISNVFFIDVISLMIKMFQDWFHPKRHHKFYFNTSRKLVISTAFPPVLLSRNKIGNAEKTYKTKLYSFSTLGCFLEFDARHTHAFSPNNSLPSTKGRSMPCAINSISLLIAPTGTMELHKVKGNRKNLKGE